MPEPVVLNVATAEPPVPEAAPGGAATATAGPAGTADAPAPSSAPSVSAATPAEPPPVHFFVSYTQADRAWAEWIAWQLENAGWSVVIQAWDFRAGGNFVFDMQRACERARRTLVVLSPDYLKSRFTAPEWAAAFAQDPTGERGLLLPVRVRACEPRGLLGQIVYVDLVGLRDKDALRQRLLQGVAELRAKPVAEPGLPPLAPGVAVPPPRPEPPLPALARALLQTVARVATLFVFAAVALRLFLAALLPRAAETDSWTLSWSAVALAALLTLAVEGLWRAVRHGRQRLSTAAGS